METSARALVLDPSANRDRDVDMGSYEAVIDDQWDQ